MRDPEPLSQSDRSVKLNKTKRGIFNRVLKMREGAGFVGETAGNPLAFVVKYSQLYKCLYALLGRELVKKSLKEDTL